ncbi:hypothetical protein A2619_03495 [candidate division WWE3 bacterium RIFOXYD1_FULL_39_9]|uniref:Uncharacterized protein n=1 Tax=candidate division WWE3 bacterium RIFOXYD1_FULL_39_9 TaxID=1802649 RepID=A0A1F4X5P0_UNCKA|nr:MAG: hypothetical protein A2619_03495 [candidate division WWE3 bacterium RIFOXYD1_FULL_39_9]
MQRRRKESFIPFSFFFVGISKGELLWQIINADANVIYGLAEVNLVLKERSKLLFFGVLPALNKPKLITLKAKQISMEVH